MGGGDYIHRLARKEDLDSLGENQVHIESRAKALQAIMSGKRILSQVGGHQAFSPTSP